MENIRESKKSNKKPLSKYIYRNARSLWRRGNRKISDNLMIKNILIVDKAKKEKNL